MRQAARPDGALQQQQKSGQQAACLDIPRFASELADKQFPLCLARRTGVARRAARQCYSP